MKKRFLRIISPYFIAGIEYVLQLGSQNIWKCIRCAPILKKYRNLNIADFKHCCYKHNWLIEEST